MNLTAMLLSVSVVSLIMGLILRWLLRINHICKRLDQLAANAEYLATQKSLLVNINPLTIPEDASPTN